MTNAQQRTVAIAQHARAWLRWHWKAVTVCAAVVLLYALAGFFLAPHLARNAAHDYVAQQLHRRLVIGAVTFNPFTFVAQIRDVALQEQDGGPIAQFKLLRVNAELASIWQRAIVLKEVHLQEPAVNLIIEHDGSINLSRLVPASSATDTAAAESKSLPRVRIGSLSVDEGRVALRDLTREQPFTATLEPIRFALADFRTDLNYRNAYAFSGATLAGEQLDWSGNFTVQPLGSVGTFSVKNLLAATVDAYLQEQLPLQLASGTASLDGRYNFALTPQFALDVTLPAVALHDLTIRERAAQEGSAPVSLPAIDVKEAAFSYGKRELGLQEIDVRGARIEVQREQDGSINLLRLLPGKATDDGQATDTASAAPWRVRLDTFRVEDAAVLAEDRSVAPIAKLALSPVALTITGITSDANATISIATDIGINETGRLKANGTLQLEPLTTQLSIDLGDFALPALQPYVAQQAAMTVHSGRLHARGDVAFRAADTPDLKFAGEVGVTDLRTTDTLLNEDFVKWKTLDVAGIDFSKVPGKLTIDRIVARAPYARVIIARDRTLNVSQVLSRGQPEAEQAEPPVKAKPASGPGFPIRIRTVQIIGGSANFADYSVEPSFATGIFALNGVVRGLSSAPSSRATVQLKGSVDRYAPVDINGKVNLLAAAKYSDVAMNFRNMELTTFTPYSGKFAGYNISKGKLSTELKYHVEDRKLAAEHHIVVDNLEFGAKTDSKDAAPIPIKLAVALLKDRNGIIDLQLPVAGTLDDPSFRLGPIIWKALLGLLTKVVTAPFAALGALFGGGEELAYVDFPAGSPDLAAAESEKLGKVAKALAERPQLKIDVPLTVSAEQDRRALAKKALAATVPAPAPEADEAAQRRYLAQLEKLYEKQSKTAPTYAPEAKTAAGVDWSARIASLEPKVLQQLEPDQATLDTLARQRAQAVQGALLADPQVTPDRVFITTDRAGTPAPGGDAVRMEMKLE